jgi:hypothetical protein
MNQPNQVQEKASKPPGLLPKNVQSWLLISLALVMVLIMWLTGGKKPQPLAKAIPSAPMVQAPLEVNDAKIAELQNRIQELQREQLLAENALAQPNHPMNATTPDLPQTQQSGPAGNGSAERPEEVIRAERKKREYLSLFSSTWRSVTASLRLALRHPPSSKISCHRIQLPLPPTRLRSPNS